MIKYPPSYLLPTPSIGDAMSTITEHTNHYLVTRPDGTTIKCHNLATARWYVRNPEAK